MGAYHSWLVVVMAVFCVSTDLSSARTVPTSSAAGADAASAGGRVTQTDVMSSSDDVRCDVPGCGYDMLLYCLSNGIIIMGSCSLKKTLCTNGTRNELTVAEDGWGVCFQATYNVHRPLEQMVIVHTANTAHAGNSDSQDSNPDRLSSEPETEASMLRDHSEAMHGVEDTRDGQHTSQTKPAQQDRSVSAPAGTSQLLRDLAAVDEAMGFAEPGELSETMSETGDNPSKPPAGSVTAEEQDQGSLLLERQLVESFGHPKVTQSGQTQP